MSLSKKISRREMLKGLGLAAAGTAFAASAPPQVLEKVISSMPVPQEQITVTLWTHVSADEQEWFKSEFPISAAKNAPDYDITFNVMPMAHGDLHAKALANMAAGQELPDIIGLTHDFWPKFLKGTIVEDNLAPIDDVIADVKDDYFGLGAWSKDGKHYGMREDIATTVYWYREDLLADAGIQTPINTWDDFLAASKSLKAPAKYMMPVVIDSLWFNYLFISQLSGTYWTPDGKWALNTPETLEVIKYLKKGVDEKVFLPVSQGDFWGSKFFAGGEVVGAIMPSWYGTFVLFPAVPDQKGKWRVQFMPTWDDRGHKATAVWGGTAWCFSKKSPNLGVVLQVAKGMFCELEARIRYNNMSKVLPAWKPALADPRFLDVTEPFLGDQKWNEVFNEALQDSVQAIQNIYDFDMQPIADEGWTNYMAGKISAEEFLTSVDQQLADMGIPLASE